TWQKLRAQRPGVFEQPVSPAPDPNAWFHVRVVVASPKVSVFVGDAKQPRLVVTQLSDRTKGLVGLWVGNGSGGDFADLKIIPHCPRVIIDQLGVWKAGAVAVPLNPLSSEEELAHALAGTGARAAVVLSRFYHKIKHLQPGTALEVVIATNIKEFLPRLLRLAYTLLKERKEGDRVALTPGDVWFQAVIRAPPSAAPPRAGPSPTDAALLMLTGGTTGVPKAALLRHHGVLMAAMQINRWFRPIIREWDDGIAFVFPPFHVAGNVGILGTALVGRNPGVLVPNPRDVNELLRTIQKERPAVLPAVPALYNAMLVHPAVRAGKVDFSSIKLC